MGKSRPRRFFRQRLRFRPLRGSGEKAWLLPAALMKPRTIGVMARAIDQPDGLGRYCEQVLRQLLLLDSQSRYLIFLGSERTQEQWRKFENAQPQVLTSRSKLIWDQIMVPAAARRLGVDLLFNPKFSLPLCTRIPGVFVLQSSDWYVNPANYPWWDNIYIRLMLPLYCRKASGLLAISKTTLDDLARHVKLASPATAITYAGVGPEFTARRDPIAQQQFRADYALPERFILTVARVQHTGHRGLPDYPGGNNERLLRAYRRYRDRSPAPLPLVVAGREIEPYLRQRGFSDADLANVHFLGFVPNERLALAYQLADCFVLATLFESFGLPILEALATGCPAIVPRTGAGPEVGGSACRLIDPYDEDDIAAALLEVTSSQELRTQMSHAGVARARNFSWRQTAERVLTVFNELVPNRAATTPMAATRS
jgi:glycosyltransferase involved in cell wall biosynthesis